MEKLIVQCIKLIDALLLTAEYLDNLLSVHHLLNVTVYLTQISLLLDEVCTGKTCHLLGNDQRYSNHNQRNHGQRNIDDQHCRKHTDDRDQTGEKLCHTLTDHLTECINIIGVD